MAGIPVTPDPYALLRGGEALNRSALPVSRLAALLPVLPTADGGVAPGDNTLVRGGGTVAPERGGLTGAGAGQNASTRETLSLAARAILHVLDGEGQAAPPSGAVLQAVPTGTPAQVATALRQALHQLVQQSGLFYESHLAEWVQGGRPLAELKSEPQARLASPQSPPSAPPSTPDGRPATAPAGQGSGAQGAAAASQPVLLLPAPAASTATAAGATPTGAEADGTTQDAARGDGPPRPGDKPVPEASTGKPGARQLDPLPARSPSELLARQVANAAGAYESVAQGNQARREVIFDATSFASLAASEPPATQGRNDAATANPIHPGTEGLVRQQLELLATQQFRWSGEAWPDVPMEWEVSRRQRDDAGAGADQPWSTRLVVDLPRLGRIEARLTLNGTGLEAAVSTVRGETASRLNDTRSSFSGNLSANGLVLMRLTVSPGLPDTKVGRP
jgi:hypothetical protein